MTGGTIVAFRKGAAKPELQDDRQLSQLIVNLLALGYSKDNVVVFFGLGLYSPANSMLVATMQANNFDPTHLRQADPADFVRVLGQWTFPPTLAVLRSFSSSWRLITDATMRSRWKRKVETGQMANTAEVRFRRVVPIPGETMTVACCCPIRHGSSAGKSVSLPACPLRLKRMERLLFMLHRTRIASRWALVLLSLSSLWLVAQGSSQSSQASQGPSVKSGVLVNVSGCLKKNAATGGYYVSDEQGRTWELTSKKVDLSKHIFHTVSVSGHPSVGSQTPEGKSEQGQTPDKGTQRFALDVTELEMVSNSCTR
jgi:hypothetical protein